MASKAKKAEKRFLVIADLEKAVEDAAKKFKFTPVEKRKTKSRDKEMRQIFRLEDLLENITRLTEAASKMISEVKSTSAAAPKKKKTTPKKTAASATKTKTADNKEDTETNDS